ncbi:MAG: DUF6252 family protein [Chitinophagales bacterium]|nr:DUF6252 family protein [Chitinophagales bacterium]MDW8273787.1 DUF6252 family protein [Chitinophagales bacterium]
MKQIFALSSMILILSAFLNSCNKKDNDKINSEFSFKVNGVLVTSEVHNASVSLINGSLVTNITSSMHKDKRTINININAVKAGTYPFVSGTNQPNTAYGIYYPSYDNLFDTYSFESGSITISSIDTVARTISGTFSGKVRNSSSATFDITEGKFSSNNLRRF